MLGMVMGSFIGSLIPTIWGVDMLSYSSIVFSALGGALGIYLVFKLTH
jgi:hypothetical protein